MAVAVDATSTAVVTGANVASYTGTANITVGTGLSNGALVVQIAWGILPTAISVHWDSAGTNQLMTSIGAATNTTGIGRVELFGLIAPTAGNKNISVTWTGATSDIDIFGVSWTGVDQTGGATSFAHVTTANNQSLASNGVLTLNITSATGNAVMAAFNNDFSWASPTATNQTQLFLSNGGTIADCASRAAGAASVSMTATNGATADNASAVGCDIVASGAAVFVSPTFIRWHEGYFDPEIVSY